MVVTAIRTQYKLSMPDRSSSSKSRSASLGRCKTWTLDSGTHEFELTGIWTPDKAINDDMTHNDICHVSNHAAPPVFSVPVEDLETE